MNFIKVIKNKYFYSSLILFLVLLVFEDTTLFKLYDMKKELNHMVEQNELKSLEINQVKEKTLQLTTNKEALEKFAREHYLMKKKDYFLTSQQVQLYLVVEVNQGECLVHNFVYQKPSSIYQFNSVIIPIH